MIGTIITGHGMFASGMLSSLKLIVGEMENIFAVDFSPENSPEDLEKELKQVLKKLSLCDSIVIFTDIMGGTPFKTSVTLTVELKNCYIIYGTNLPLLLEFSMLEKENNDMISLINQCISTGKEQMRLFQFKKFDFTEENYEDGI
ncbi:MULTISPECIES: PTS galactosamine/N-acetylgalactosamine transporter subunit IIA [Tissierellales]|uniref:PTS sugar transporter subunit IIA n=1 Tax=Acidilutibacter cellobiosedens TaxID=2507161 RepID=A0A410QFV8_9FIRM|nr:MULTISPECIES: PTS galactosamine/N-acetylgalactosamine transporter subunit IIA [Tissierellales]QAT62819.1 PTS sugar transporter subunit IIA [Acidilutibacter cellobiosedens]SCL93198.1 EIIAB-Man [Sporanaerobacter sp. PP17-6a]